MSSMYLSRIKLSLFGESHGAGLGVVIDGLPAGESIDLACLQQFLDRRAPGRNAWSSARSEGDVPEILSGLERGMTNGSPLCAIIRNTNARREDYAAVLDVPRPGHADYTAHLRYNGFESTSGGGHFSGRLTAALCIAGGIARQILARRGILLGAHLWSVGEIHDRAYDPVDLKPEELLCAQQHPFPVLDVQAGEKMRALIHAFQAEGDSLGGIIECAALGVPAGIGDPVLDGMENRIARLVFAIPAVKGIEFGAGFDASRMCGSACNDAFYMEGTQVRTRTNHAGGILSGITNGMPLIFRAAIKPTPSIAKAQQSVSLQSQTDVTLETRGRHDPCIAPRAVPCMEAALAIALLDASLE